MRALAVRLLPALAAMVLAAGCLADMPGHLPSSVRIIYSKTIRDSLGVKVDVYFLLAREGNELRLTDDEADDIQPSFSSGLRRVFFVREREGGSDIWSMDLGGGDETRVLSVPGRSLRDPDVSPDGTRIAFTSMAAGRSSVEVASMDGSGRRELIGGSGTWSQPRWSPDGRRVVVVGREGGVTRLYLVDAEGGDPRPLTPQGGESQADPDWSPDGRQIVHRVGEGQAAEIAVTEVEGPGGTTVLTDDGTEDARPAFSPSGERIVFVSRRPDGRWNLWLMDADGSDAEPLTSLDEGEEAAHPDWI